MMERGPKLASIEEIYHLTADLKSESKGDLERLRSLLLSVSTSSEEKIVVEMPRRL